MNERTPRAKIRELITFGALVPVRSDGSLVSESGRLVSGQRDVGTVSSAICIVCGEPGPPGVLPLSGGLTVHLHTFCDVVWQEGRQA